MRDISHPVLAPVQTPTDAPAGWDIPGSVVYLDDPDEAFQQQLAAANYRAQRDLLNTREWFDDGEEADPASSVRAGFTRAFWLSATVWLLIALLLVLFLHPHRGKTMSPETPVPPSTPKSQPEPHGHTLQAAIDAFGNALVIVSTHPDTEMFFFNAQDLVVNQKLMGVKLEALIDSLCAAGHLNRTYYENRLESKLIERTQKLVNGANRLAFTARVTPGAVNGGGH